MITMQNNLSLRTIGSPCRFIENSYIIYGRYVGDSNFKSTDDPIILISTPHNSIIHAAQSNVCFNVTDEELLMLKDFEEDAKEHQEWYHSSRSAEELSNIGSFISSCDIDPICI